MCSTNTNTTLVLDLGLNVPSRCAKLWWVFWCLIFALTVSQFLVRPPLLVDDIGGRRSVCSGPNRLQLRWPGSALRLAHGFTYSSQGFQGLADMGRREGGLVLLAAVTVIVAVCCIQPRSGRIRSGSVGTVQVQGPFADITELSAMLSCLVWRATSLPMPAG